MDSTKRVARSGGLAIAVGLGVVIASPGLALAEPSNTSASPSADSSPPSSAPASDSDSATPPDSGDIADSSEGDSASDIESTGDDSAAESEDDTAAEPEEDHEAQVPVADIAIPSAAEPATAPESGTPETELVVPEIPAVEPIALHGPSDNVPPVQPVVANPQAAPARAADPAQADATEPAEEPEPQAHIDSDSPPQMVSTATTEQSTVVAAQPVPELAKASAPAPSTGLMSRLLGWVGLSPELSTAPAAPLQLPGLFGWIALAWHEVRRSLFNSSPTTAWSPDENSQSLDGVITGDLHVDDANGDPLTFTVTDGPDDGAVVINPDGTFVYTPSAGLALTGGTDEFTVRVKDQGFHLHGLFSALLNPDFGHATIETVGVTVDPVTNIVTATIEVGENPRWVAVSPDGTRVYVTNEADENVSVIDTATNTVITTIAVGDEPYGVAVNPDGATAYVTNASDDTVSVIDVATNTVIDTITVGNDPRGVAFSSDGATAYVTNANSGGIGSMSVIDAATNTVIDTIVVGEYPRGVAVSPDDATVYVSNEAGQSVAVIDAATINVSDFIDVGPVPEAMAVSPDGARLYVVGIGTVSVIDTAANTVIDTIDLGNTAPGIGVSPDGAHVYVTGGNNPGDVSVIDTATNIVIDTIAAGTTPGGLAVSPDGTTGYVANYGSDTVSVIRLALPAQALLAAASPSERAGLWDLLFREIQRSFFNQTPTTDYTPSENIQTLDDNRLVATVTGDFRAVDADGDPLRYTIIQAPGDGSVVVNPDGTFVYTPGRELAAAGGTDQFVVKVADVGFHLHGPLAVFKTDFGRTTTATIDIAVNPNCAGNCQINPLKVIATIDVGEAPDGVVFNPAGTRAYVANQLDNTVSVINTATNTVIDTINVGNMPRGVAVHPFSNRLYVTNLLDDSVTVINTSTNAVITTVAIDGFAERVAVSGGGTRVYVIGGGDLSVISTATNTVTKTIPVNGAGYGLAVNPQGGSVFVATQIDWVDKVNVVTNVVTHVDTDAGWLTGIVFNPLGTRVYYASRDDGTLTVRNASTDAVIATINVGEDPRGVAMSPDGTRVYVVNKEDDTVSQIRTSTNTVLKTISVGDSPNQVAISPDGTRAYVTNSFNDSVSVLQL